MTIEELEDALISKINASMTYLKKVSTYQGELDEEKIEQFIKNFPSVLIYMEKSDYIDRAMLKKWQDIKFTIFVCDKNLRGNKYARRGDASKPGTYKMLDDLFSALHGETLGLEIDPIDIQTEEAVLNTSKISVYAAVYRTRQAKN